MPKLSPIGRVSYPSVFEPTQVNGQGEFKFRITLLLDPNDPGLKEMREECQRAAMAKWPQSMPKDLQLPFIDGDTLNGSECQGKIVLRFTAKEDRPPQICNADLTPITKDSGLFYSGCHARVSYNAYGWTYMNKHGVSFGFNNVQKFKDDEPFDGRSSAENDFDALPMDQPLAEPFKQNQSGDDISIF